MTVIKSAMVLDIDFDIDGNKRFHTIFLDSFDHKPYRTYRTFDFENMSAPSVGDLIDIKRNGDSLVWEHKQDYKNHAYEYAVILDVVPLVKSKTLLKVYGNKIDVKDATAHTDTTFNLGQKVLLEKYGKTYSVVHNITKARMIYDMQQNGPQVR